MSCKPVIGLNAEFLPATKGRAAYSILHSGYYDCIMRAGGIPVAVPPLTSTDERRLCPRTSRWLCAWWVAVTWTRAAMGSCCIPPYVPCRRGGKTLTGCWSHSLSDRCVPTFGIGAGMQLLNVSQGGNLFLHIPEDRPTALPHADSQDPAHRHGLQVTPGSLDGSGVR